MYDEYGIALYPKDSSEAKAAEKFIHALSLCYLLSVFQDFLGRIAEIMHVNDSMTSAFTFLSEVVEKVLIDFAYRLDIEVSQLWAKNHMIMKKMPAYILDLSLSELWSLVKRTADTKCSANAILRMSEPKNVGNDADIGIVFESEERVHSTLLLTSQTPIISFVINPLNTSQLAYITANSINEIDSSISQLYYGINNAPKVIGSHENIIVPYSVSPNSSPPRKSLDRGELNIKRTMSFESAAKFLKRPFRSTFTNAAALADKGLVGVKV